MSAYLAQFYEIKGSYKTTDGEKVILSNIRWINYGVAENDESKVVDHHDEVWFRTSFDDKSQWQKIRIDRGDRTSHIRPLSDEAFNLYDGQLPVTMEKVRDLHRLATKYLAPEHRQEYPAPRSDSSSSESESDDEYELEAQSGSEAVAQAKAEYDEDSDKSQAPGASGSEEQKQSLIENIDAQSMIIYDIIEESDENEESHRLSIGRVTGVDVVKGWVDVHRYGTYHTGNDVSKARFFPAYMDSKDNKMVYSKRHRPHTQAVTDYVEMNEVKAKNFDLHNNDTVPTLVAKKTNLLG
jgi:hypothetical protein